MDRETIYQFGLSSGCIDPDLSGPDNWVTDYGGCEGCLIKFAQLVAAHEREEAAKLCDRFSKESHFTGHAFAGGHLAQKIRART